jgi:hypothetical protein
LHICTSEGFCENRGNGTLVEVTLPGDMSTALATKSDLLLIRQEIDNKFALLSRDIESTRKDIESPRESSRKDLETLRLWIIVRLGSMLFVGFGLMLAAMKLWIAG